jgi:dephospho-CoA kinase
MVSAAMMKKLGITGGIGMGKSTSAAWFERQGIPVIDTDVIARQIVEPGQPALAEIIGAFGPEMVTPHGQLDRARLAELVFRDIPARNQLESILHPRIRLIWQEQMRSLEKAGNDLAVVVIPLLFETQSETELDFTLCVACSEAIQFKRLHSRGWNREQIQQRIAAQWPVNRKMAHAQYVVWNESNMEMLARQQVLVLTSIQRLG